ncbi:MAG: MTAP family purine nucleoside phosphorylase [Coriobacteriia bacterium]|nr:MTAP family purine nucleoside phosphorylase [Coriobacteriia bacterium]
MRIGIIGGTGAELGLERAEEVRIESRFGRVDALRGRFAGGSSEVVFVRRHGEGHRRLSSMVDHRANVAGLREAGCAAVVATTVCGVLDPEVALGTPLVFDDLFFPDNRLPDGSPCTFFDEPGAPGRGHYVLGSPFSPALRRTLVHAGRARGLALEDGGTYAYALGPRFNSRAEVAWLRSLGAVAVSQTAGPEAVLAGELELPYALVGFGVDYANGVQPRPTPVEVLDGHIAASREVLRTLLEAAVSALPEETAFDTGFVYRFE